MVVDGLSSFPLRMRYTTHDTHTHTYTPTSICTRHQALTLGLYHLCVCVERSVVVARSIVYLALSLQRCVYVKELGGNRI